MPIDTDESKGILVIEQNNFKTLESNKKIDSEGQISVSRSIVQGFIQEKIIHVVVLSI